MKRKEGYLYKRPLLSRISDWLYGLKLKIFPAKKTGGGKSKFIREQRIFITAILILPIINWFVFWLYVNLSSFVIAFQNASGEFSLINFQDFWNSISKTDGLLNVALLNTFRYFFVNLFIQLPINIVVCYFFFKRIRMYKFFRVVFFLPAIISGVALTGIYKHIIDNSGPIGYILTQLGVSLPMEGLLGNASTATNTIIAYTLWTGVAGNMLILSGTMARIPMEVLESARIEGAKTRHELIMLVIPLIWPTLSTLIILMFTGLLSAGGPIMLLQPAESLNTWTSSYWIFAKVYAGGSFGSGQYRLVSATGLCFTLVLVPITLLFRKLIERIPAVEY